MRIPTFASLLLIFALQLTQLGGLTHGITHLLAGQAQDTGKSLPHNSEHCDLCAAYAQIGCALASSSPHFLGIEYYFSLRQDYAVPDLSRSFAAFAARAPPRSA